MLKYLTAITLFDVAGDFIQSTSGLPIPGPVIGVAGHGIGTARTLSLDETARAFAGRAMGHSGLLTAVLLLVLFHKQSRN